MKHMLLKLGATGRSGAYWGVYLLGGAAPVLAEEKNASLNSSINTSWVWVGLLLLFAGAWLIKKRRAYQASLSGRAAFISRSEEAKEWSPSSETDSAFINRKHTVSFFKQEPAIADVAEEPAVENTVHAVPASAASKTPSILPDQEAFLQAARQYFMSLQAAFDKGDLEPFRDWMVPELRTELGEQVNERGGALNQTEILTLSAKILEEKVEEDANWVSVRFFGTSREHPVPQPHPFDEAWHFKQCRFTSNDPWKLAGIERLNKG